MRDRKAETDAAGLKVLGVSFDSQEENKAFAEKFDFPYPLLCDTDKSMGIAYGAADDASAGYAKRISYVIDGQGKVQLAYPKVDVSTHLDDIFRRPTNEDLANVSFGKREMTAAIPLNPLEVPLDDVRDLGFRIQPAGSIVKQQPAFVRHSDVDAAFIQFDDDRRRIVRVGHFCDGPA